MRRWMWGALAGATIVGCGTTPAVLEDGSTWSVDAGDAESPDAAADRGPTRVEIDGDPNGLWWDVSLDALFIADDNGNRILRWSDAEGLSLAAELPAAPASGPGLGQVVRTSDGTFVVTRFGAGTTGDVVYVTPSGEGRIVPGLDPQRRRIGLSVAPDGTLYDAWFVRVSTGARVGAVGSLDLAGLEPELITGLVKPVGVLATADSLFVSDQDLGQVLRAARADPSSLRPLATLATPDLLCAGPDGSIFVGTAGGSVARVGEEGSVEIVATGYLAVRGVAFDAARGRLFVAEHDSNEADGIDHALHIVPVD